MKEEYSKFLLEKTKSDYNRMALKFSSTRKFLSSDILSLKEFARGKILDLGCGNGRLFEMLSGLKVDYTGADISEELLKIARKNYKNTNFVQLIDPIKLPFGDSQFDTIYSLAVFHHIPSLRLQQKHLAEIKRVLKPEGTLIMTVWNLIERPGIKRQLAVNNLRAFLRLSALDKGDIFYNFKDGDKLVAKRYIHCFAQKELTSLLQENGFKIMESKIVRRGKGGRFSNIAIVASRGN